MNSKQVKLLVLEGGPLARGRIHGETLREEISHAVGTWTRLLEQEFKVGAREFVRKFLDETDFIRTIETWTPDLLEEIRGIAEGSGIDRETILAYQLLDETAWYAISNGLGLPLHGTGRCSAIGAHSVVSGQTIVGQNMDLPAWTDGHQVMLHVKPNDSPVELVVASLAGMLCTTGMNNCGIGLGVNALVELSPSPYGLPVAFVIRRLLQQSTFADAVDFLSRVPHASGQNYLIGSPDQVASYECSVRGAVQYRGKNPEWLCHTNHALVSDDRGLYEQILAMVEPEHGIRDATNSRARLTTLELIGGKVGTDPRTEDVLRALSSTENCDFPVCRDHPTDDFGFPGLLTVFSTVCELSGTPRMHYCAGPPNTTEFSSFSF